jgi:hypothetical protein
MALEGSKENNVYTHTLIDTIIHHIHHIHHILTDYTCTGEFIRGMRGIGKQ